MSKRLLLTGAGGFVAGSIIAQAGDAWEVHAVSRKPALAERAGLAWHMIDPLAEGPLENLARELRPAAMMHTAAIAGIDYCQNHRAEADLVNTTFAARMVRAAEELDCKLVHLSTDNVFDGTRGLYTEEDPPAPVNYYGQTKMAADVAVQATTIPWVIARVSLVMGLPVLGEGNSFLSRMMAVLEKGERLGVPADEIRSPVDVVTLGQSLLELAANDFTGIINMAGDEVVDRCEMVRRIARTLGCSPDLVFANDPTEIPGRAPRPVDVSLSNALAKKVLQTPTAGIAEGMKRILRLREGGGA